MKSLVWQQHPELNRENYVSYIDAIATALRGRVKHAYVFGSAGTDQMTPSSDID